MMFICGAFQFCFKSEVLSLIGSVECHSTAQGRLF